MAPKHLWSLYDKIEKLKKQDKNKITEKRVKRFTEIADKIQSKKESIKKRKKELREKIRKTETEAGAELRLMQKELDKYERED